MSALRKCVDQIMKFFAIQKLNRDVDCRIRPLSGDFYVEYLSSDGDTRIQSIDARHLIYKGGMYYLRGWCEQFPCYRTVAVERMTTLADIETGELVPQSKIALWLARRSLH
jgi:hypothetical protein